MLSGGNVDVTLLAVIIEKGLLKGAVTSRQMITEANQKIGKKLTVHLR